MTLPEHPYLTTTSAYLGGKRAVAALNTYDDLTPWQARWLGERASAQAWAPEHARCIRAFYLGVARALSGSVGSCSSLVPTPTEARSRVRRHVRERRAARIA